ncbi:hypothetical protein GCM10025776_10050 [Corallincola platygyrae]
MPQIGLLAKTVSKDTRIQVNRKFRQNIANEERAWLYQTTISDLGGAVMRVAWVNWCRASRITHHTLFNSGHGVEFQRLSVIAPMVAETPAFWTNYSKLPETQSDLCQSPESGSYHFMVLHSPEYLVDPNSLASSNAAGDRNIGKLVPVVTAARLVWLSRFPRACPWFLPLQLHSELS